jgi:hypothetical protein
LGRGQTTGYVFDEFEFEQVAKPEGKRLEFFAYSPVMAYSNRPVFQLLRIGGSISP